MPYTPQTWVDNNASYPLSAARMNTIETGIQSSASVADQGHRILTTTQRDALTGVTAGTMIYNTTLNRIQVYFNSAWVDADQFRTVGANNYSTRIVPPMCKLLTSTTQSVANNTDTLATLGTSQFDTDAMGTTGANAKITINTTGVYCVSFGVAYATNATGLRIATIVKNGVGAASSGSGVAWSISTPISSVVTTIFTTTLLSLTAADYLQLGLFQNSGGALNFGQYPESSFLSAVWVGRTS